MKAKSKFLKKNKSVKNFETKPLKISRERQISVEMEALAFNWN